MTIGIGITDVAEFNRRAAIALRALQLPMNKTSSFVASMCFAIGKGRTLTPKQQQYLYNVVDRYKWEISDKLICDFAALHKKEY